MEAQLTVDSPAQGARIADMRCLGARDLDSLLLEETLEWQTKLDWDFSRVAALVRRLADAKRLGGAALLDRGEVAGYACGGVEEDKGLIVDVYLRSKWRTEDAEALLFRALLDALIEIPEVRRVESQLMLTRAFPQPLLRGLPMRRFERLLLKRDATAPMPPGRASNTQRFRLDPWRDCHSDDAAAVLSLAYAGHIDSQIRDHYRTFGGASRMLRNIVEVQGSDTFCPPASFAAFDAATGAAAGLSLASFVAGGVGHISELCVVPASRGCGLGQELLQRSVTALLAAGADRISLTVTAANQDAVRLYARCGFHEAHRFFAYLWERG